MPSIAEPVTAHWSGYVLLVIYAASQISSTYFMSSTMDKTQRTMMMLLPLVFIFFLLNFPVGLVIYWVTTNLWTVGQGIITRRLVPKTPAAQVVRRSSRTPAKAEPESRNERRERRRQGRKPEAQADAQRGPRSSRRGCSAARRRAEPAEVTDELQVETTGETVGEAKWQALRELERLDPDLDKAAVRFQVVSEGERGLLGVGYSPARVVATVDADVG